MQTRISHLPMFSPRWIALLVALGSAAAFAQPVAEIAALEAAATRGDAGAMVTLASKLERGENVERDFIRSNELYCKAAARGDAEALLKLGLIYSIGRAVLANEAVAARLINRAAEMGNERAKELLEYVGRGFGGADPACLHEKIEPPPVVEQTPIPVVRKDIELLVQEWAPKYSVDPALVLALISTESGFNANAVSPKNAQGLMQLIPATAERFGVKNAYNPVDNLKGGLAYLRWLMAYFKGEVALVLAAYNAGEEAVERHRGIPPYRETINYVKQITSVYKKTIHPYVAEIVAPSPALGRIKRAD